MSNYSNRWYRLCVDVDQAGNPIGISAELHLDDEPIAELRVGQPGPFTDRAEAVEELWSQVLWLKGEHRSLF